MLTSQLLTKKACLSLGRKTHTEIHGSQYLSEMLTSQLHTTMAGSSMGSLFLTIELTSQYLSVWLAHYFYQKYLETQQEMAPPLERNIIYVLCLFLIFMS